MVYYSLRSRDCPPVFTIYSNRFIHGKYSLKQERKHLLCQVPLVFVRTCTLRIGKISILDIPLQGPVIEMIGS